MFGDYFTAKQFIFECTKFNHLHEFMDWTVKSLVLDMFVQSLIAHDRRDKSGVPAYVCWLILWQRTSLQENPK